MRGSGGVRVHSQLSGLTADDHTQYALLAGRAGGQTLIGGTGAGDDLTYTATSNATPGDHIWNSTTGTQVARILSTGLFIVGSGAAAVATGDWLLASRSNAGGKVSITSHNSSAANNSNASVKVVCDTLVEGVLTIYSSGTTPAEAVYLTATTGAAFLRLMTDDSEIQMYPGNNQGITLLTDGTFLRGRTTAYGATTAGVFERTDNTSGDLYMLNLSSGNAALARILVTCGAGSDVSANVSAYSPSHATLPGLVRFTGAGATTVRYGANNTAPVEMHLNDVVRMTWAATTGNITFAPAASAAGSPTHWTLTGAAHTTLTASTEATDVNWNLARTVQFAQGALATQRAVRYQAPTYAFVAASTITTAATVAVSGAPAAGANATITNAYALWVEAGASLFAGNVTLSADRALRFSNQTDQAAASTGTLTNAPAAGDPAIWVPIVVNGTNRSFPAW